MAEEPKETWNPWGSEGAPQEGEVQVPPPPPNIDMEPTLPANVNSLGKPPEAKALDNKDPHREIMETLERIETKVDKILGRL